MGMRANRWWAGALCGSAALIAMSGAFASTMKWADLLDRPRPKADVRIPYGHDPLQYAELWLPADKRSHPVVLMVHGGCWQTDIAEADIMNYIANDLRAHGIAVWNIEYRGVDRAGGGYPGTFLDVAAAADALRSSGPRFGLKINHVVAFGHSAGGHLALWLAARGRIPKASPLYSARPLPVATAISVGGLPDLEDAQTPPGDTCDAAPVHKLLGTASATRPDRYRDTSPAAMMPFSARQVLVNATRDRIAPPASADRYEAKAKASATTLRRITIPEEGHVELIAPDTASWRAERAEIERALNN